MLNPGSGLIRLVALMSAILAPLPAGAQVYPSKGIRIIVPVPPGGIVDNATRPIADRLGARLGQQIVIDNRPPAPTEP